MCVSGGCKGMLVPSKIIGGLTAFSTVYQSYHDDVKVIMKGCVQWKSVYCRKDFSLERCLNCDEEPR